MLIWIGEEIEWQTAGIGWRAKSEFILREFTRSTKEDLFRSWRRKRSFDWQDGYSAFTIGISQLENTIRYINNQERHHAKMDFAQELEKMLKKHGIKPYTPRD